MKLEFVEIENYRAIDALRLSFHPSLTVLHGDNAHGKTSVLSAIAVGLAAILEELPEVRSVGFRTTDRRRASGPMRASLTTRDGVAHWCSDSGGLTTDPDYFEDHAESIELWSPGNPLFRAPELLAQADEWLAGTTLKDILER